MCVECIFFVCVPMHVYNEFVTYQTAIGAAENGWLDNADHHETRIKHLDAVTKVCRR